MSLFLLTKSDVVSERAQKIWSHNFRNNYCVPLSDTFQLVLSNNYENKEVFIKETSDSIIVGIGTWFSEDGFFEEALPIKELENFTYETFEKLYGHYLFIIYDKSKESVRLFNDPIGLINIYKSESEKNCWITNDPYIIACTRDDITMSKYGIHEFILKENTIGSETLFNEIKRLKIGHEFLINESGVEERKFFKHEIESLSFYEYSERVENYFNLLAKYPNRIGIELSAGYDSKLIAACASVTLKDFKAITNDNSEDRGIDLEGASIIAKKLDIPLVKIIRGDIKLNKKLMFHSFSLGRNIVRSKAMPETNRLKYEHADLLLGGYGGEIIRSKYSDYDDLDAFIKGYYNGETLFKCDCADSFRYIKETIEHEYLMDWLSSSGQSANWFYMIDRMRIWGGSSVVGKMIYGDRLHPFMDWQLLKPILNMEIKDLKKGKLIDYLIDKFSPELSLIPVNPPHSVYFREDAGLMTFISKNYQRTIKFLNRLKRYFGIADVKHRKDVLKNYTERDSLIKLNHISNLDYKILKKIKNPDVLSRYLTVEMLLNSLGKSK